MADMHFDAPFTVLANKKNLGNKRRLEQREVFRKAIEYIKEENIPFLFISGDLYEHNYVKKSTIEYINNLFKEIPNTKIFISPGNHDPFLKDSFYNNFNWNENVHIFNSEIETIELNECDIYGYGFSDFYCINSGIENIKIKNKNKINILITHAALDSSKKLDMQYNPINSTKLKQIGFDYVALGHIHKKEINNEFNFIYPGSTISFGFDELGDHGILEINLEKNKLNNIKIKFIKLDNRIFEELKINISENNSQEEIIEKINKLNLKKENNYKIILTGTKKFEVNTNEIIKLIVSDNVLKIYDQSSNKQNIDTLTKQENLKGMFAKEIMSEEIKNKYTREEIEMALELGLKLFE
jgi:exonuclease SbcD